MFTFEAVKMVEAHLKTLDFEGVLQVSAGKDICPNCKTNDVIKLIVKYRREEQHMLLAHAPFNIDEMQQILKGLTVPLIVMNFFDIGKQPFNVKTLPRRHKLFVKKVMSQAFGRPVTELEPETEHIAKQN
jgi:hypothetical protein